MQSLMQGHQLAALSESVKRVPQASPRVHLWRRRRTQVNNLASLSRGAWDAQLSSPSLPGSAPISALTQRLPYVAMGCCHSQGPPQSPSKLAELRKDRPPTPASSPAGDRCSLTPLALPVVTVVFKRLQQNHRGFWRSSG